MQVRDYMSPSVVSITPEESAALAARLLARHNVGALPVCGPEGNLRGMVTDRDIVLRCVAAEEDPARTRVKDIMTVLLETIRRNEEICLLLFSDNGDKNFLRNILMFALPSAVENWVRELGIRKEDATLLYYYVMGGAVNVIEAWMKDSFSAPLDDVAEKLNALILGSQEAFVSSCSAP